MLAKSAGYIPPPAPVNAAAPAAAAAVGSSSWILDETVLDRLASLKHWEKIETNQPAMASYRKNIEEGTNNMRLNFYLSTGTVGSCLDHPTQGKTQLFRRQITDTESAAVFFDNPRQHTGKGYYTKGEGKEKEGQNNNSNSKKRKVVDGGDGRICAKCGETKPNKDFSKNQRRKGSTAKCFCCV